MELGQDRIALDAEEEKALEAKREMVASQERVIWNPALSLLSREFDFSDQEVARLKCAIATRNSYGASANRRWLGRLISALFSPDPQA